MNGTGTQAGDGSRRTPLALRDLASLPALLTVGEVAELVLGIPESTLYDRIAKDEVPGVRRVGRRMLIATGELLDWLGLDLSKLPPQQTEHRTEPPSALSVVHPLPQARDA